MARRRGSHSVLAPWKTRDWSEGVGSQDSLTITASGKATLGLGIIPVAQQVTLARTRGLCELRLTAASAAIDGYFGAVGICKISTTAAGIGITAIPGPVSEMSWDGWLWHDFFGVHAGKTPEADGVGYQRLMIDSKAMRKIDPDEVFAAVIEVTEIGTASLVINLDTRMLFLLS